jgi:hypothetical protein
LSGRGRAASEPARAALLLCRRAPRYWQNPENSQPIAPPFIESLQQTMWTEQHRLVPSGQEAAYWEASQVGVGGGGQAPLWQPGADSPGHWRQVSVAAQQEPLHQVGSSGGQRAQVISDPVVSQLSPAGQHQLPHSTSPGPQVQWPCVHVASGRQQPSGSQAMGWSGVQSTQPPRWPQAWLSLQQAPPQIFCWPSGQPQTPQTALAGQQRPGPQSPGSAAGQSAGSGARVGQTQAPLTQTPCGPSSLPLASLRPQQADPHGTTQGGRTPTGTLPGEQVRSPAGWSQTNPFGHAPVPSAQVIPPAGRLAKRPQYPPGVQVEDGAQQCNGSTFVPLPQWIGAVAGQSTWVSVQVVPAG